MSKTFNWQHSLEPTGQDWGSNCQAEAANKHLNLPLPVVRVPHCSLQLQHSSFGLWHLISDLLALWSILTVPPGLMYWNYLITLGDSYLPEKRGIMQIFTLNTTISASEFCCSICLHCNPPPTRLKSMNSMILMTELFDELWWFQMNSP